MNKNLQHSKVKAKAFNLFKSKDNNLQHQRAKTKAFNFYKDKNKNLQPQRTKQKPHKHKCMKVIDALGQIC
jgi:hypothetical protein